MRFVWAVARYSQYSIYSDFHSLAPILGPIRMSPDTAYGVANRTGHSVINAAFESELKELFDGLVAALGG